MDDNSRNRWTRTSGAVIRGGHVTDAAYKEPFDLPFPVPKFDYGDVVGRSRSYSNCDDILLRMGRALSAA